MHILANFDRELADTVSFTKAYIMVECKWDLDHKTGTSNDAFSCSDAIRVNGLYSVNGLSLAEPASHGKI